VYTPRVSQYLNYVAFLHVSHILHILRYRHCYPFKHINSHLRGSCHTCNHCRDSKDVCRSRRDYFATVICMVICPDSFPRRKTSFSTQILLILLPQALSLSNCAPFSIDLQCGTYLIQYYAPDSTIVKILEIRR
jgi:hypothetical protein